jgi:hypothetical protein
VDAHRSNQLTLNRPGPSHRTDQLSHSQLAREIDELERNLRREDPALVKQFRRLDGARRRNEVTVFSLLAVSAVLLAIALAVRSPVAGLGGVGAYLASFVVDRRHQRTLRRTSSDLVESG